MPTTGKVTKVSVNPRSFLVETNPGPPPQTTAFTDGITDDVLDQVQRAFDAGSTVECSGTPPTCGQVSRTK